MKIYFNLSDLNPPHQEWSLEIPRGMRAKRYTFPRERGYVYTVTHKHFQGKYTWKDDKIQEICKLSSVDYMYKSKKNR